MKRITPSYVALTVGAALFVTQFPVQALDCVPAEITLTTQLEVDNFQSDHGPGCTSVVGDLVISGLGIENLDGLAELRQLGSLILIDDPVLSNVSGLSGVQSVQFGLILQNVGTLQNLDGLATLDTVGGTFNIENCPALTDVSGLQSLSFAHSFALIDNAALVSLVWPPLLTETNEISLGGNSALTTISGVQPFSNTLSLDIVDNDALTNLDGFLAWVGQHVWNLSIRDNDQLTSLSGLSGVDQVAGELWVKGNSLLPSLDGLGGIVSVSQRVVIADNASLGSIAALSTLSYIGSDLQITSNPLLESLDGLEQITKLGEFVDFFCLFYGRCTNLELDGNNTLSDVSALSSLMSVNNDLKITNNPMLEDCSPLDVLLDSIDDGDPGPGPGQSGIPDVGRFVKLYGNLGNCNDLIVKNGFESD